MRKHEKFIQIDIKVQVKDTTSKKEQNIQTNNKDTTTGRIEEYIMRDMTARRSGAQRHLKQRRNIHSTRCLFALSSSPFSSPDAALASLGSSSLSRFDDSFP